MASHVVLRPGSMSERGFLDASERRAALPKAYNAYADPPADPVHRADSAAGPDDGFILHLR
jgi:hypothetical protein